MPHRSCSILLFVFSALVLPLSGYSQTSFWADMPDDMLAKTIASEMNAEELLGQVLMFGYGWTNYSWDEVKTDVETWVRTRCLGSIKTFGWNGKSLERLAREIVRMQRWSQQTRHKVPLIIATDQEGGWVRHVQDKMEKTPGNIAIGASGRMQDAYETAFFISRELLTLGINMNFAPTVDLYTNLDNYVIGPRSFSDDPETVAQLGLAFLQGAEKAGMISTAKHFPGHGDTDVDSHGSMPVIDIDFDTLWNRELVPYKLLISEDVPAIMSGHLGYPQIEPDGSPASLSSFFLDNVLRERLGYKGVIVTDDLDMGGSETDSAKNISKTAFDALSAGNDILLISKTNSMQSRVWNYLREKMKGPEILRLVREKAELVIRLKLRYIKKRGPDGIFPSIDNVKNNIPDKEGKQFFLDHAFRSTTVIRNSDMPLSPSADNDNKVLLTGQVKAFFEIGSILYPNADRYKFPYRRYTASPVAKRHLKAIADNYDIIIYCLDHPASSQMLSALKDTKAHVYVISSYTPVYISDHDWVKNVIAVYGFGAQSMEAGFYALQGKFTPEGKLPLSTSLGSEQVEDEDEKQ